MGIGGRDPFLAPSFIVCGFECSQTVDISCFLSIIWVGWGWGARGCCPVGFLGCFPNQSGKFWHIWGICITLAQGQPSDTSPVGKFEELRSSLTFSVTWNGGSFPAAIVRSEGQLESGICNDATSQGLWPHFSTSTVSLPCSAPVYRGTTRAGHITWGSEVADKSALGFTLLDYARAV